jgi:hypothetical protein
MGFPVNLTLGDHDLTDPVLAWSVAPIEAQTPTLELIASIASHPKTPPFPPTRGQTATTLAIRMGPQAAMQLYEQLGELGRSMDWLPPA